MPALFTATNGFTLIRKVVHSARQLHPTLSTRWILSSSRLSRVQRARLAFKRALNETYSSLALSQTKGSTSHGPFGHVWPTTTTTKGASSPLGLGHSNPFRGPGFRLGSLHARGPAIAGQVGLGPARAFSSMPAPTIIANAPVYLRALLSVDDNLPKSTRYEPYKRKRITRINKFQRHRSPHSRRLSSASWYERVHSLDQYFPAPLRSSAPQAVELPILPETLITSNATTTLSIALSPSLQDLLEPTTQISYREAELGLSIFADLLRGIPAVLQAFSIHGSTRTYPLLSKLDSLGVLDSDHPRATNAILELVPDSEGRPDILNIVFPQRSVKDVKRLLGESLDVRPGEGQWFGLYESRALTPIETSQIAEHWENDTRSATVHLEDRPVDESTIWEHHVVERDPLGDESTCDLVFPTLDFDRVQSPASIADTPPEVYSWPSTGCTTPISTSGHSSRPVSPASDLSHDVESRRSNWSESSQVHSLSESLISRLEQATSPRWLVHPTSSDSDIESLIDLDDLGEVEHELWSNADISETASASDHSSRGDTQEIEWLDSRGFGLIQPW
ncbi:hypothetical protein BD324DRAFT_628398 [Kockovaella imperatae]|uniref:Uncharacterized protein n=1 Tax=Kockovaella imperatae TaxID=4999 RepID=A0A1Y1UE67_9TREE|nr:hypothetical protein BD324DRAFT_628398 [Kockovaella imperatae]ORX36340.1 hypothetical protein BD324DRAFT_628398 [Kockovaella imperatae]